MQHHAPPNRNAPAANRGVEKSQASRSDRKPLNSRSAGAAQGFSITVGKSATAQLRVSLVTWRGITKLELRELTAIIAGTFFPAGTPVTVPVEKLPELIEALQDAEREARARGLLPSGRAVA